MTNWAATSNQPWLIITPSTNGFTATASTAGLPAGTHTATIIAGTLTVPVTLAVE